MAGFNLSEEVIELLQNKFRDFQAAREKIHELLGDYVADVRRFKGNTLEQQEYLREKYAQRAPTLSHLVWNEGKEIYWGAPDIAIVMGRNQSSIARTLTKLEQEDGWCVRLLALRKDAKAANGLNIHVYHQDIFDLILDRYEDEYLLRFAKPRYGNKENAPDIKEVRRFWEYMKDSAEIFHENFIFAEAATGNAVPLMRWRDILSLIWKKIFTIRTGMFFSIFFAASFEAVRRWPEILPYILASSGLIFTGCIIFLHLRKGPSAHLASLGAGTLLFLMLWGVGLSSSDGTIQIPGGARIPLITPKRTIDLMPIFDDKTGQINFLITADDYNVKEFLYRVKPDTEYRSTGFMQQINTNINAPFPKLEIESLQRTGTAEIEIKCIDAAGREQGPWLCSVNIDREFFNLHKKTVLNMKEPWVFSRSFVYIDIDMNRFTTYSVEINKKLLAAPEKDVISAVIYGINTEQPEITIPIENIENTIIINGYDSIQYVSSRLVFKDGSSSDVRQSTLSRR